MSTTITEHPHTATVASFYEALARGDIEAVAGMMSPDITVLMPGRSPLAGLYTGRDAVLGFLGQMQAVAGGMKRPERTRHARGHPDGRGARGLLRHDRFDRQRRQARRASHVGAVQFSESRRESGRGFAADRRRSG